MINEHLLRFHSASSIKDLLVSCIAAMKLPSSERKMLSREKARAVTWCWIQRDELNDSQDCSLLFKKNVHALMTQACRKVYIWRTLLRHVSANDATCEQSYHLITGWGCILMFHPPGLLQVGTNPNSSGAFPRLCLFHTFVVVCLFVFNWRGTVGNQKPQGRQRTNMEGHGPPVPTGKSHKVLDLHCRGAEWCGLNGFLMAYAKRAHQTLWYSHIASTVAVW